jgi:hypothetical protein
MVHRDFTQDLGVLDLRLQDICLSALPEAVLG